jgi:hypothetical protein
MQSDVPALPCGLNSKQSTVRVCSEPVAKSVLTRRNGLRITFKSHRIARSEFPGHAKKETAQLRTPRQAGYWGLCSWVCRSPSDDVSSRECVRRCCRSCVRDIGCAHKAVDICLPTVAAFDQFDHTVTAELFQSPPGRRLRHACQICHIEA